MRARIAVVSALVYLGLMVTLYAFLCKRNTVSLDGYVSDSITHGLSIPHYEVRVNRDSPAVNTFNETAERPVPVRDKAGASNAAAPATGTVPVVSEEGLLALPPVQTPSYCLHAFYYMWYGNSSRDGRYYHWNHRYLPHWDDRVTDRFPKGRHEPPDDVGASYYPLLGAYSSSDSSVMAHHVRQLTRARVGVLAVSWYPPDQWDDEGFSMTHLMPRLLDIANKHSVKVAVHLEPYKGRTPLTLIQDLVYIYEHYNSHPALLKVQAPLNRNRSLPLVYVYDAYLSPVEEWREILREDGGHSIRGTKYDCVVIALLVSQQHRGFVKSAGFDGFYTYFASEGFSYGSSIRAWAELSNFARANNLLFVPSAGPGYDDTQVRPWNTNNRRSRDDGQYYVAMMRQAFKHNLGNVVSITSFNEWHEGTQIEAAVPKNVISLSEDRYLNYQPHDPWFYLDLTANLSEQFTCNLKVR